jgi:hypothetical protein
MKTKIGFLGVILFLYSCSNTQKKSENLSPKGNIDQYSNNVIIHKNMVDKTNPYSAIELKSFEKINLNKTDRSSAIEKSQLYFERATEECNRSEFRSAYQDLTSAINAAPDYAGAFCVRALVRLRLNDTSNIMEDFNRPLA